MKEGIKVVSEQHPVLDSIIFLLRLLMFLDIKRMEVGFKRSLDLYKEIE
jgi:hypothetical protein